jgi:hypothetical protein
MMPNLASVQITMQSLIPSTDSLSQQANNNHINYSPQCQSLALCKNHIHNLQPVQMLPDLQHHQLITDTIGAPHAWSMQCVHTKADVSDDAV